jgi:hypothetical protein
VTNPSAALLIAWRRGVKPGNQLQGVAWYLGTIQYGTVLFGGGALWFLAAWLTGFFGGDLGAQVLACLLLLALIAFEAWWSHMPTRGNPVGDYLVDFLSSAAIAGFGMAVVLAILLWLPR